MNLNSFFFRAGEVLTHEILIHLEIIEMISLMCTSKSIRNLLKGLFSEISEDGIFGMIVKNMPEPECESLFQKLVLNIRNNSAVYYAVTGFPLLNVLTGSKLEWNTITIYWDMDYLTHKYPKEFLFYYRKIMKELKLNFVFTSDESEHVCIFNPENCKSDIVSIDFSYGRINNHSPTLEEDILIKVLAQILHHLKIISKEECTYISSMEMDHLDLDVNEIHYKSSIFHFILIITNSISIRVSEIQKLFESEIDGYSKTLWQLTQTSTRSDEYIDHFWKICLATEDANEVNLNFSMAETHIISSIEDDHNFDFCNLALLPKGLWIGNIDSVTTRKSHYRGPNINTLNLYRNDNEEGSISLSKFLEEIQSFIGKGFSITQTIKWGEINVLTTFQ